jgi:hypothetical protein
MQKIKWPFEHLTNARSQARTQKRIHTNCDNTVKCKNNTGNIPLMLQLTNSYTDTYAGTKVRAHLYTVLLRSVRQMHVRKRPHILIILACSQDCLIIPNNKRMVRKSMKYKEFLPKAVLEVTEFCS